MRPDAGAFACSLVLLSLALGACSGDAEEASDESQSGGAGSTEAPATRFPDDPPGARRDLLLELRRARDAARSPADGGGRAWLVDAAGNETTPEVTCGTPARFTIRYAAGPEGLAEGGFLRLTPPPFWGWSRAQVTDPEAPGYVTFGTAAEGVTLEPRAGEWLDLLVQGRGLREGEELELVYGDGAVGAVADRYAEAESRLWISVDGDGDGIGAVLRDSPAVRVRAGAAAQVSLLLPSTAEPGEPVTLRVALLDGQGNLGVDFDGSARLAVVPEEGLAVPETLPLTGEPAALELTPGEAGVYRVLAELELDGRATVAISNPLLVADGVAPVRWGDLHGHSNLSDGTGTPEDYLRYAREVAALDVVSLTDHDHWGMLFLDQRPDLWERIRAATAAAHAPGEFVAILGYEWTSWVHGHRHVLYFADDGPVLSSVDERYETPAQLWEGLRGLPAMTFAHHSAGGPVPTDWDYPPDPELETLTEIVSVHGSSEAADSPGRIYDPLRGNYVRDVVLERGYRLGFVGSGDGHDGHPGLTHLAGSSGGLAAILTDELTRDGVREALRSRRTYATSGQRILLRAALEGHRMGAVVPASEEPLTLYVRAIGTDRIVSGDLVTEDAVVRRERGEDEEIWDLETLFEVPRLRAGEACYVRVVQADGGCAWSSPFFAE